MYKPHDTGLHERDRYKYDEAIYSSHILPTNMKTLQLHIHIG